MLEILVVENYQKKWSGVTHHCIDVVSPKKIFTVVDFKKCAEEQKKFWRKIKQ